MTTAEPHSPAPMILEAGRTDRQYWNDVWRYRELFFILAWRDVSVRYKQTMLGVAWAFMRPFLTMVVFTVVFGQLAKLPPDGDVPYAVMVFAGLLPWTLFSSILGDASSSVMNNANLISKVFFPRLLVPMATVMVALIDFAISLTILVGLMIWYAVVPGWHILLLPFFVALTLAAAIGPALWASALVVKYRDFRFVIPFVIQIGLYASPVGFSSSIVPEQWRLLYSLNPMVGIIDGFRWSILGGQTALDARALGFSLAFTTLSLAFGVWYFRRMERSFADVV